MAGKVVIRRGIPRAKEGGVKKKNASLLACHVHRECHLSCQGWRGKGDETVCVKVARAARCRRRAPRAGWGAVSVGVSETKSGCVCARGAARARRRLRGIARTRPPVGD